MKGRKGRIVGADDMIAAFAFDHHGPAPLNSGIAGGEAVAERAGHGGFPHVDAGKVRELVEEGFEGVEVGDDAVSQIDIF